MATTATATPIYRLRRGIPGGWAQGQLVRVVGDTPATLAEFVANHFGRPEKYDGPIDYPDDVAELNLSPAMDFSDPPIVKLPIADVKQRFRFTDAQLNIALNHLAFPSGELAMFTDPRTLKLADMKRLWREDELDLWAERVRSAFPNALPKR